MKRLLAAALLLMVPLQAGTAPGTAIAAKVDGVVITKADLDRQGDFSFAGSDRQSGQLQTARQ